ncbi:MAG: hypothetical protein CMI74_10435 [Candidatus Pelagibacter sp.]|jgi:hypothetical protein|nr:hypothetical protein [Candidatus Pelagibacter sp.]|tara:strand:+ start:7537 stop:8157 length:621 start_codon:yes stop_codon:yes gene_type:complete
MANINVAFGFKPVGKHGSSPATQGTSQYFIASDASAIFQGSPVKAELTGGTIQIGSATGNGDQLVGIFAGCEYVDATTGKLKFSNTWPGSGSANTNFDIKGFVYDDPSQRFIIASDGTNTDRATAKADIFKTADIASGTSGNTTTGISSAVLDISTSEDTDTSNCVMILGIHEDVTNADHSAAGVSYIVKINNHALNSSDADATAS